MAVASRRAVKKSQVCISPLSSFSTLAVVGGTEGFKGLFIGTAQESIVPYILTPVTHLPTRGC